MTKAVRHKKPTVKDVAREAKVSLATVDRVLNGRPGVRPGTVEKVNTAVEKLHYSRDLGASLLARATLAKIHFMLPDGNNPFYENLALAIAKETALTTGTRTNVMLSRLPALDTAALCDALDLQRREACDCAVIVANDDERVRKAVARARLRGVGIVTLVSDLPKSKRQHFVGINNEAAGRTAASLMGRFVDRQSRVGLIVGSMGLRDHRDRFIGFHDLMLEEFPDVELVGPAEGFDDPHETAKRVREMFSDYPDLAGLYSIGAGNEGLISSLRAEGKARRVRVIAHELTDATREGLTTNVLDVVLDQDPRGEIRAALSAAQHLTLQPEIQIDQKAIEIGIYLRDNLADHS